MMDPRHQQIEKKFQELSDRLSHPETLADAKRLQEAAKEHAELEPLVRAIGEYRSRLKEREDVEALLKGEDAEMRALARSEVPRLEERIRSLEREIRDRMAPKDPDADRNAVVEIRAGTGGEEAALFAADLFRMYSRYCEKAGWKMELLDSNPTTIGGFKEIVFLVSGKGAYGRLRNESGTHRVQRVPRTESSGRIHTSAATVAVLPEADETEVKVRDADLRIDTFCSSGAGGQSVNTTYSAVRITHLPTGLVVQCQDERSQLKNKNRALKVLYARLKERADREAEESLSATRRSQVGSGDRSEKIRTYNFPQNRMTDHRIGLTLHQLDRVLEGDLEAVFEALAEARRRTQENGEG